LKSFVLAAALAALLPAVGGTTPPQPEAADAAADAAAPVPRVTYRSVFQDTPTGVEEDRTDWRKANADVGQFQRGHIDLLKWEAAQPGGSAPAQPSPSGHKH
jgi:hypothetical protein